MNRIATTVLTFVSVASAINLKGGGMSTMAKAGNSAFGGGHDPVAPSPPLVDPDLSFLVRKVK